MKLVDDYQYPIKGSGESSYNLDSRMQVAFIDCQVIMWSKGNTIDDVVVIEEHEGGLYKLKGYLEQALIHDIVVPNELWHRRLAHVHYRALIIASKVV